MLTLRYRRFWITASLALVALVVWGSLQTAFETGGAHGFDKFQHFGTYLFLAAWFTGLVARQRYWLVVAGLLGLGLLMELGQYAMQAGRMGDPYDMAANTAGVAAGVLLAVAATGGWAQKVERWLSR
jgi:VanZ family protein